MDDHIDWPVVVRYLGGECTPAEHAALEAWMSAAPDRRAYVESLRRLNDTWAQLAGPFDSAVAWRDLEGRLSRGAKRPTPASRYFHPRGIPHRWSLGLGAMGVAGAIVVAVVALGYGVAVSHGRLLPRSVDREYRTAAGQRETVRLPDGTQFTLAPASTLHVPLEYGSQTRAVTLEGEGFFTVVHDARHPFSVRAGNAVATDVGTAFDVRAYAGDDAVRVAVAEGQVDVAIQRRAARRSPLRVHDVATISDTSILVTHDVDLVSLTAWASGRLEFHDTPLRDVARELARWYDLEVEVPSGPTGDLPLTGAFTTEPIDNVISVIASTLGVRVQHRGRTVRFLPPTPRPGAR